VREAGSVSQHRAHRRIKVRNPAFGSSKQVAQSTEALGCMPE